MAISLGVIGLGRMAQSLLLPLLERGDFSPDEIFGVVRKKESIKKKLSQLPEGIRVVSADDPLSVEVWSAPIKILAVKPQQFSDIEENLNQLDQTSSQKALPKRTLLRPNQPRSGRQKSNAAFRTAHPHTANACPGTGRACKCWRSHGTEPL